MLLLPNTGWYSIYNGFEVVISDGSALDVSILVVPCTFFITFSVSHILSHLSSKIIGSFILYGIVKGIGVTSPS